MYWHARMRVPTAGNITAREQMFCSSKCLILWGYTIWEDITGNHLWKLQLKINTTMFTYLKMC